MNDCVRFRGRERRVNVPQEIGTKYHQFGVFLLEDLTGARIESIALKHSNDPEQINTEILQQWITGRGRHPVTWKTLIQVLRDIDHSTLAGEIEAIKCYENTDLVRTKCLEGKTTEQRDTEYIPSTNDEIESYEEVNSAANLHDEIFEDEIFLKNNEENQRSSFPHRTGMVNTRRLTLILDEVLD